MQITKNISKVGGEGTSTNTKNPPGLPDAGKYFYLKHSFLVDATKGPENECDLSDLCQ